VITASLVLAAGLSLSASAAAIASPNQAAAEVIAEVRVHGNQVTPDAEMIRLSGVAIGDSFLPATIGDVRQRLIETGRFERIQVLKRYTSVTDASRIALVIIVDEGPVRLEDPKEDPKKEEPGQAGSPEPVRVVKRGRWSQVMFLPVLYGEDGYGLTYGARLAYPGPAGPRSRLSFPLTWGGEKEAGVTLDRTFVSGPISRFEVLASMQRTTNPAYDTDDSRRLLSARGERAMGSTLRAGTGVSWETISFGDVRDEMTTVDAEVVLDTRLDPVLPRDAIYARARWARQDLASGLAAHRTELEGRGYVGLMGQTVLGVRVERRASSEPLPPYLKSLLGGWSSLRGFRAGAFATDTTVAGSIGLTIPLSSVLSTARYGLDIFTDAGVAYDRGESLSRQPVHTGIGGALWFSAATFRIGLSVAHGLGDETRVNFGVRFGF
jgi:outer membrane protein assembly factor BamA